VKSEKNVKYVFSNTGLDAGQSFKTTTKT